MDEADAKERGADAKAEAEDAEAEEDNRTSPMRCSMDTSIFRQKVT